MIEIKNVKQIGTPREDGKIYVENLAYVKLMEESYQEKRAFILMGHTERMEGRYATFVEAVIPVKDIEFSGNVPRWNNSIWSQVFREIKRTCEEMIIVGWALDLKGMSPGITPELERVHREHFGGVHQIVFLMDTLEQEETFYIYKENRLVAKDGFYIYYKARKMIVSGEAIEVLDLNEEKEEPVENEKVTVQRGRYRQFMLEQKKEPESGGSGLAMAIAMLVFIVVIGAYENRGAFQGIFAKESTEAGVSEATEESEEEDTIPVEIITGTEK